MGRGDTGGTRAADPGGGTAARVLARLAVLAAIGAVIVLGFPLGQGGLLVIGAGLLGLVACAVGVWWFLAYRGVVRLCGALVAVAAPVGVVLLFAQNGLWPTAAAGLLCWTVTLTCARAALRRSRPRRPKRAVAAPRPRRPALIMNPKSGDGKVERFGLVERAEALGARVILLDPSAQADVAGLARKAVAEGADLLGVAGGDGTQALVAEVAAEHDLPFLVVSAGTRNHFALDLGLDRTDPSRCLDALSDGEELRVDLGSVAGRPFVNTVSFGVYADVVQRPEYRDDKAGTALDVLPDLLQGGEGDRLDATVDAVPLTGQQALLVSNNPYAAPDPLGAVAGRRTRLDGGELGVIGVRVDGAAQAAELAVLGTQATGLNVLTARRVEVGGSPGGAGAVISVAVDGEALTLPTPVVCTLRPGALRVLVPRDRPGSPLPPPPLDWRRLTRLAFPEQPAGPARGNWWDSSAS